MSSVRQNLVEGFMFGNDIAGASADFNDLGILVY